MPEQTKWNKIEDALKGQRKGDERKGDERKGDKFI